MPAETRSASLPVARNRVRPGEPIGQDPPCRPALRDVAARLNCVRDRRAVLDECHVRVVAAAAQRERRVFGHYTDVAPEPRLVLHGLTLSPPIHDRPRGEVAQAAATSRTDSYLLDAAGFHLGALTKLVPLGSPNQTARRAAPGKDEAMTDLPADVRDRYRRLAQARRWPPETEAAFLDSAAYFRALDEGPSARGYFERVDDEGLAGQRTRWLWETVTDNGAVIAVKQIEIPLRGAVRRYWWRSLEDDGGFLTDQPLVPDEEALDTITCEAFYEAWDNRPTA
jgi:hypothetical protein